MLEARTFILPSKLEISVSSCDIKLFSRLLVDSRRLLCAIPSIDISTIGSSYSSLEFDFSSYTVCLSFTCLFVNAESF